MRLWSLAIVVALLSVCCSDNRSVRFDNPTTPTNPGNQATPLTGTWVGAALDSTGGMMGSGQGQATITLQLNQNGTQVTGTMDASGFTTPAGQAGPTIVGTVSGQTFTFTITAPAGTIPAGITMPVGVTNCSATSTGTMTLSGSGGTGSTMTGSYTGIGSCSGAFSNGQITLTKQ